MALLPMQSKGKEPKARNAHAAVVSNHHMLVWGGDGGKMKIDTSVVEIFDIESATWQESRHLRNQSLRKGLYCMAVACDGKRAYTFGGVTELQTTISDIYEIDLATLECRLLQGSSSFSTRASAMVCYKRKLVNYGGRTSDGSSNELNVFDLDANEWAVQATIGENPPALYGHSFTIIDHHKAVVFGGLGYGQFGYVNKTYLLDMEMWQWNEVSTSGKKPVARYYHSACVISSEITGQHPLLMVIGGVGGLGRVVLSDVWFMDVTDGSWSEISLPTPLTRRYGHSAVVFGTGPDFRVVVLFGGNKTCNDGDKISETTMILMSRKGMSWVADRVVDLAKLKGLNEQLKKLQISSHIDTEFPELYVVGEAEEVVVLPEEPVTLSPVGHGVSLTVPAGAVQSASNTPAIVSLKTCLPNPSFTFPEGYIPVSAVYRVSAPSNFKESVQLKFEHFATVDTEEQAKEVVIFKAKSSPTITDGKSEYIFHPVEDVERDIVVGKGHCTVSTHLPGFMAAGLLQKSKIPKRYAVLCSYSNGVQGVGHAAIAVTVDDAVYMSNFREAVQKEWGVSLSNRCKLNVYFAEQDVRVEYPQTLSGWKIVSSSSKCIVSQEDVDFSNSSALCLYDYPPRVLFEISPTENAEPCTLQLRLSGLSTDVNFQISLRQVQGVKNKPGKVKGEVDMEKPTLLTLESLSTHDGGKIRVIEDTANHYLCIGHILLNDRYGERVEIIENDMRGKREHIILEVYKKWMREDVNYSWITLAECFRECGLHRLAHSIERHFKLPSPPLNLKDDPPDETTGQVHPTLPKEDNPPDESTTQEHPVLPKEGGCSCCILL